MGHFFHISFSNVPVFYNTYNWENDNSTIIFLKDLIVFPVKYPDICL